MNVALLYICTWPSFGAETFSRPLGLISCQICQKQEHGALDCYHSMNFSYQGCHPPSQLATMVVNSMHSQASGENTNNVWFSDSGCNVHMTYELTNLNLSNNYNGDEIVTVVNDQPLNIQNTGSGKLQTPSHTFNLSKILHAHKLVANLLSVHKFCLDNNCIFIFDTDWFLIQDKVTGRTLYTGESIKGLYPTPNTSTLSTSNMHSQTYNFHAK